MQSRTVSVTLLLASAAALALASPLTTADQQNHSTKSANCGPCGWIHYRGDRNSFTRSDVTENIFCPCASTERCLFQTTRLAERVHVFSCQRADSEHSRAAFPVTNSRRRRRQAG